MVGDIGQYLFDVKFEEKDRFRFFFLMYVVLGKLGVIKWLYFIIDIDKVFYDWIQIFGVFFQYW